MVEDLMFTEAEAAKLAHIAVERKLRHFKELLGSGESFSKAVREAFGEEEKPNEEAT